MTSDLSLGFTAAWRDPVEGAYPLGNGYRWYSPALMRFSAPDDLSPFGSGGVNPYAYCEDDPINHSDPSGHAPNLSTILEEVEENIPSVGEGAEHLEGKEESVPLAVKSMKKTKSVESSSEIPISPESNTPLARSLMQDRLTEANKVLTSFEHNLDKMEQLRKKSAPTFLSRNTRNRYTEVAKNLQALSVTERWEDVVRQTSMKDYLNKTEENIKHWFEGKSSVIFGLDPEVTEYGEQVRLLQTRYAAGMDRYESIRPFMKSRRWYLL